MQAGKRTLRHWAAVFLCVVLCTGGAGALYGDEPGITASGVILYERGSGQILFEQNAHDKLFPASTTKVMTALLCLEYGKLDEMATVSYTAMDATPAGSSIAGLRIGEELSLHDLLICTLVASGNDASNVIAEHVAGSIPDFVDLMNRRAKELGCENTNFVNPSGFHDDAHYTTASDLLLITLEAMKHPEFMEICGSTQMSIGPTNKYSKERFFNNTNYMLSATDTSAYLYEYATGIKTGSTTPAGRCLIASAENEGVELVCVILGAATEYTQSGVRRIMSFLETKYLFEWAFRSFSYRTVIRTTDPIAEVHVQLALEKDYVVLRPEREIRMFLHHSVKISDFDKEIQLTEDVIAPVRKDQVLGKMTVSYKGVPCGTMDLLAVGSVDRSPVLHVMEETGRVLRQPWVSWAIAGIILLFFVYLAYVIIHNRRQRKALARRRRSGK